MATPLLITDANIAGALKNVYLKYRTQTFPVLTPLLANIKKLKPGIQNAKWGGNGVYFDVVATRPTGLSNSPSGYFPNQQAAKEVQGTIGIQRSYVTRQIDGLSIRGTADNNASFVPLAKKVMDEAMAAAKLGQQEQLMGDGKAIKGIVSSVTSSTVFVINSPYGVAASGHGRMLIDANMYLTFRDTTGATVRSPGNIQVSSAIAVAATDNVTVTVATVNSNVIATDICVASTANDDSYNNYINGLLNISNRGNSYASLHGISNATTPRWDAIRMVAGTDTADAAQPSELDVWQLVTLVANKSGHDATQNPDEFLLITTPGVYRKLGESFLGQRRWDMGSQIELNGGFKAISVCGIALIQDPWCIAGTVYLIHKPSLIWLDLMDFQPVSYEGVGPWRFVAGRDAYEWSFGAYWNAGALQRNSIGSITSYTDTVRYDFGM